MKDGGLLFHILGSSWSCSIISLLAAKSKERFFFIQKLLLCIEKKILNDFIFLWGLLSSKFQGHALPSDNVVSSL